MVNSSSYKSNKKKNKLTEENCNLSFEYLLKFYGLLNKNNSNLGI